MAELSAEMIAARGGALQADLEAVQAVADAAVTPAELEPYALLLDNIVTISATTYTITGANLGQVLVFTSADAITVTLAAGVVVGVNAIWRQDGAGQITFVAAGGATLHSFDTLTKSAGQYAEGSVSTSVANVWNLSGTIA